MAKKTLEVATLLCCVIEELHTKFIMLSYSLLSLLIKHAMILNILRRYQLSPPPGLVKSRANFSLLQTPADGASPVLELREVEAFCGTLGRRKEGERGDTEERSYQTSASSCEETQLILAVVDFGSTMIKMNVKTKA